MSGGHKNRAFNALIVVVVYSPIQAGRLPEGILWPFSKD